MKFFFFNARKKRKIRLFSLVELMVSMAVFAVLILLTVQLATSAKSLWIGSEKRFTLYGDARTTMDLIETMLRSSAGPGDRGAFQVLSTDGDDGDGEELRFVTNSPRRLTEFAKNNTYAISIFLDPESNVDDDEYKEYPLTLLIFDDQCGIDFYSENDPSEYWTTGNLDKASSVVLATGIIDFSITLFDEEMEIEDIPSDGYLGRPHALRLDFRMLSDSDAQIYQDLSDDVLPGENISPRQKFANEHAMSFTRLVYLSDRQ